MSQRVIITGASNGIGFAVAKLFLASGWQVVTLSRSACDLVGVEHVSIDLSDHRALNHFLIEAAKRPAMKTCVVHAAAYYHKDSLQNISAEAMQQAYQVNMLAPTLINQTLLPVMLPGSSLLYLGSTLSEKAVAGNYSYVLSKHAVVGMMRASCQDLAGTGVHTACICPGFTDTDMLRSHIGNDPSIRAAIAARVGDNRLIEPEEIAALIYYAAENPVINGAVLHANLGQIES